MVNRVGFLNMKISRLSKFDENTFISLGYLLKTNNGLSRCLNLLFNTAFKTIKKFKQRKRSKYEKKLQNMMEIYRQCKKKIYYTDEYYLLAKSIQNKLQKAGIEAELVKEINKDDALYFVVGIANIYPDRYILMTPASQNVVEQSIAVACPSLELLESYKSKGVVISKLFFYPNDELDRLNDFYFYRLLLSFELISFETFFQLTSSLFSFKNSRGVCLSLIESQERRAYFNSVNKYGFEFFDGLRHQEGWIGCGLSYKFLIKLAKRDNMQQILIMEDDVVLSENFKERYKEIVSYLAYRDDWDVFSGLMAHVSTELRVLGSTILSKNQQMIFIDQLVSTVFNVYSKNIFDDILQWNERSYNKEINQIDQYIKRKPNARYVVTLPFLVGHNQLLTSIVNPGAADRYEEMIEFAEFKLRKLIKSNKGSVRESVSEGEPTS